MRKEETFLLGTVVKLHGFDGTLGVTIDSDNPKKYTHIKSVFIEMRGQLVPYLVSKFSINGNKGLLKLQEVTNEELALKLKGKELFLPLKDLPPLKGNKFYFHEIVGFTVVDKELGKLGTIATVYSVATQDLISMEYEGVEVLIPINDSIVTGIDRAKQELYTQLPEGLVDVYTSAAKAEAPDDFYPEDLQGE